jgi:transposase
VRWSLGGLSGRIRPRDDRLQPLEQEEPPGHLDTHRPLRLVLTPGNTSDVKGADLLIGETAGMKRVIADRGYDANRIRAALREQGTIPVIPGRRNRKRPIHYDERRYKDRWRLEAMFCRLKDFRRIATRYDKLARNFLSAVSLAAAVAFWL